jgi:hypothetical protein
MTIASAAQPDGGAIAETRWTDTRSCEGARAVLADVRALPPARPTLFGIEPPDVLPRLSAIIS